MKKSQISIRTDSALFFTLRQPIVSDGQLMMCLVEVCVVCFCLLFEMRKKWNAHFLLNVKRVQSIFS